MRNTSTLYAFLQKRAESAEIIAGIAGTHTVSRSTERHSKLLFMDIPTGEKSVREVEEYRIHPNLIKTQGVGECAVIKKYPRSMAYRMQVAAPR